MSEDVGGRIREYVDQHHRSAERLDEDEAVEALLVDMMASDALGGWSNDDFVRAFINPREIIRQQLHRRRGG